MVSQDSRRSAPGPFLPEVFCCVSPPSMSYDGVFMPGAMDRKWKGAASDFPWQWIFPAKTLTPVPDSGEKRRYHRHETHLQKALRRAVRKAPFT